MNLAIARTTTQARFCAGPASAVRSIALLLVLVALSGDIPIQAQTSYYYQYYSRAEDSLLYEAVRLIDAGKIERARELLRQAQKEYPANSSFPYELAYILYGEKKYSEARDQLEKLIDAPDVTDRIYQLLGNTYDLLGDPAGAIRTYDKGLKLFPKSGPLYLERGIMSAQKEEIPDAMDFWEEGIARDPSFSSNYFHAARYWMISTNPGWGLIYGEIFLNLEPKGKRADAMRALLWGAYNNAISKTMPASEEDTTKSSARLAMFKETIVMMDSDGKTLLYPFTFFYSGAYMKAGLPFLLNKQPALDIAALHAIRTSFLDNWYANESVNSHFAVDLFDRQQKLRAAGLLEAYDYTLFRTEANATEARQWREKNRAKMMEFEQWLTGHTMSADTSVAFARKRLKGMPLPEGYDLIRQE